MDQRHDMPLVRDTLRYLRCYIGFGQQRECHFSQVLQICQTFKPKYGSINDFMIPIPILYSLKAVNPSAGCCKYCLYGVMRQTYPECFLFLAIMENKILHGISCRLIEGSYV